MARKTFIERYTDFLKLCRGIDKPHSLIPNVHCDKLEYSPKLNPSLIPTPREWLIESFDWFMAIQLIPGESYGPFYRIDGDNFWPEIGNPYGLDTEKKCFFGLERPLNKEDARRLYNIREETKLDYVYEVEITLPEWPIEDQAFIFMGAVKDGEGYQMNPNGVVVQRIRSMIIRQQLIQYHSNEDAYDYANGVNYRIRL